MELGGRAHDAHGVGVGEVAEDPALVLDPVLHADDGDRGRGDAQLGQCVLGVLALDPQQDDGVLGPGHEGGLGDDGDGQGHGLARRLEAQSRLEGPTVFAPGHQGDVVALLEQAGPDRTPDGTGSQDDEAHGMHSATPSPWEALAVPAMDAIGRAAALGESVAGAPLRLVGELTAPARGGMQRSIRRAIGIGDQRGIISSDPDEAFMPPDGVARQVHGDLAAMVIGGVSALFLQTLHPLAMAGVADHSGYRDDPLGRLRRTAQFVGTTTYGTTAQAEAAVAQVLRVHRRVKGIAPDGRKYSAADPELVTFIHVAEISSFLASSQRYGSADPQPEPSATSTTRRWPPSPSTSGRSGRRSRWTRPRATCCACGPSSTPVRRPARPGTGCCAAWPSGRASAPSTRWWWRRPSACCRDGPAASSASPWLPPVDFVVDTLAVTPLMRMLSDVVRWVMPPPA